MDYDEVFKKIDKSHIKTEKRKTPSRNISEQVFDKPTLLSLYQLNRKGLFEDLNGVVSVGKEAHVFHATGDHGEVAVKIYMVETSDFKTMSHYVRGDPRFGGWANRRQLVSMWAKKEYKNLMRVSEKVRCPKPLDFQKNILVMEFIGEDGIPAPKLKETEVSDPQMYFDTVVDYMRQMYMLRLVHSDLSQFNVLDYRGEPVIIDFSTGVLLDHPRAMDFLQRDISNIVKYFNRLGVDAHIGEVLEKVTEDD